MKASFLVIVFTILLVKSYQQTITDSCVGSLTVFNTTFLFTEVNRRCNEPGQFNYNEQLQCGTSGLYNRFGFQMLAGPPFNASVIVYDTTIFSIPDPATKCSFSTLSCDDQAGTGCQPINPLVFDIVSSRIYLEYNINEVMTGQTTQIPFSWVQTYTSPLVGSDCGGSGPAAPCTCTPYSGTGVSDGHCTGPEDSFFPQDDALLTGPPFTTQCGTYSDPNTGYSVVELNQLCATICCSACMANATSSTRRIAVGPRCTVYTPTAAVGRNALLIYAAFTNNDMDVIENYIETDTVAMAYTAINENSTMRFYISDIYKQAVPIPTLGGAFVFCYYDDTFDLPNMGAGNPYVELEPPLEFGSKIFTNPLFRAPSSLSTPAALGAGKVPTINSLGGNVSMFYLPPDVYSKYYENGIFAYAQNQDIVQTDCLVDDYAQPSAWQNYIGLPGWQVANSSTTVPYVPSPCIMSNDLNYYGYLFNQSMLANNNNVTQATIDAGPPPPWLPPGYLIGSPNWWGDKGSVIFDLGTQYKTTVFLYQFFVDIPQQDLPNPGPVQDAFAILKSTSCNYKTNNGTGTGLGYVYIENESPIGVGTPSFQLFVTVNCTAVNGSYLTTNPPVLTTSPVQSVVVQPQQTLGVNFTISSTAALSAGPNCTIFVAATSPAPSNVSTSILCNFVITPGTAYVYNGQNGGNNNDKEMKWIAISAGIILVVVIVVAVIVGIVLYVEHSKAKKKNAALAAQHGVD